MKTITLPAGTEAVRYDELAHLIALAMWPLKNDGSPGDGLNYGFASVTLERELAQAVEAKDIPLKDPLTLGPYIDHPGGTRLEDALVRVDDLRKYVADRGVVVVVNEIDTPAQALEHVPCVDVYSAEKLEPTPQTTGDGLPTKDIATLFDGVNDWPKARWPKNLSGSVWLHPARTALGGAGGASSMWNPLTLAQLIHDQTKGNRPRELLIRTLKNRFNNNAVLIPWRDAFNEYFDTFTVSD